MYHCCGGYRAYGSYCPCCGSYLPYRARPQWYYPWGVRPHCPPVLPPPYVPPRPIWDTGGAIHQGQVALQARR